MIKATFTLARLYQLLAEALAEPLPWLAQTGRKWALFDAALEVAHDERSTALQKAGANLVTVPPESLSKRQTRYQNLLNTPAPQPLHLHESLARSGRLAGTLTFRLWSLYRSVGLDVADSELPDHVSVELGFLAYLVEQEILSATEASQWQTARRLFLKQHAGQWMPALGRAIAKTADAVYAPIGHLLTAIMKVELYPRRRTSTQTIQWLPNINQPEVCNLCSFCVQVCPTRAIAVHETHETTSLLIQDVRCVSCNKCAHICPTQALALEEMTSEKKSRVLCQSPRASCPGCGSPTVSQAEINAIVKRIGKSRWLDYCSDCRVIFMEELR